MIKLDSQVNLNLANETVSKPTWFRDSMLKQLKGLILAQNERWRRGLGMQVEREALD